MHSAPSSDSLFHCFGLKVLALVCFYANFKCSQFYQEIQIFDEDFSDAMRKRNFRFSRRFPSSLNGDNETRSNSGTSRTKILISHISIPLSCKHLQNKKFPRTTKRLKNAKSGVKRTAIKSYDVFNYRPACRCCVRGKVKGGKDFSENIIKIREKQLCQSHPFLW